MDCCLKSSLQPKQHEQQANDLHKVKDTIVVELPDQGEAHCSRSLYGGSDDRGENTGCHVCRTGELSLHLQGDISSQCK